MADKFETRCRMLAVCLASWIVLGAATAAQAADSDDEIIAEINRLVRQGWEQNKVTPSKRCEDGEFARRVSLDVIGRIPTLEQLGEFFEDTSPTKRRDFVNKLLDDPDYVTNWSTIWANMLVGRGGRNNRAGRPLLEAWLRRSLYKNQAYNQFAFDLISAEGDSDENGAVNFLSAHLNDGAVPATAITSRIFLGLQVQCTQCHNHPFNDWKQSQFWGMNAFFRGTRAQRQGTDRGDIVLTDNPATALVFFEKRSGIQEAVQRQFVDGSKVDVGELELDQPRKQLAKLVTDPTKPFLTQTQVNRVWGHLFGYGFTKPVDDMGPHNPPSNAELVNYLSDQFTKGGFDNKRLIRWITASEAYSLSSQPGSANKDDDPAAGNTPLFSRMYLKNFTAEQLYDSLIVATDAHKANRNADAAENQRRDWLNQFIRTFGTDDNAETTSFNGTITQALLMMNGDLIASATGDAKGSFLRKLLEEDARKLPTVRKKSPTSATVAKKPAGKPSGSSSAKAPPALQRKIDQLYLASLCRTPTDEELRRINDVFQEAGTRDPIAGLQDLFWAILNSNEFIINH
ncbi:MAG: DUF1549 domain-containing protein [Planctomycetales bacterium]|nr:DUF1549 domain-containing protein [Planctomycetales bacterium]